MRWVVVDPGVLVSALIKPEGPPGDLWRAVERGEVELIVSPLLPKELADVLGRGKFRRYVTADEAARFVDEVADVGTLVPDPPTIAGATPDPKDDYLVTLARVAAAEAIVSGDNGLLAMRSSELLVVSPREASDALS